MVQCPKCKGNLVLKIQLDGTISFKVTKGGKLNTTRKGFIVKDNTYVLVFAECINGCPPNGANKERKLVRKILLDNVDNQRMIFDIMHGKLIEGMKCWEPSDENN